jgi:vacuolar-type H+-ATPase subunit I/STV1
LVQEPITDAINLGSAAVEAIRQVLASLAAIDGGITQALKGQAEQAAQVADTLKQALARVAKLEEQGLRRESVHEAKTDRHEKALKELAGVIDHAATTLKETAEKLGELKNMASRPAGWRFEFDRNENGVIMAVDAKAKTPKKE